MNWITHSTTDLKVGFEKVGGTCEGGNCKHLKRGDKAYGHSSENDSWGSEVYLMCEKCYTKFLEHRKTELVECGDCHKEVPRNTMYRYIPYIMDGSPSENEDSKLWICAVCRDLPRHLNRLERDAEERRLDDDWNDRFDCDDGPDEEPYVVTPEEEAYERHNCLGLFCRGCEAWHGKGSTGYLVFDVAEGHGDKCWSRGIKKIEVGVRYG